jgi:DNA-binding transcriptional ArsR family regulator
MVEHKAKLDLIFHALADTTRREILQRIIKQKASVTELAAPFAMSLNAISKHLKVLEKAGLVKRIKKGRLYYFMLNQQPLEDAATLVSQLQQEWELRLDALENYFETFSKGEKK